MMLPLRPDQEAHLVKLCEEMGRTPEDFVREAVLTFMEDYEDARDANEALEEAKREGKFYSSEEVRQELGLEHHLHSKSSEAA
jgi:RHH-type transcriptional regulator, rel operon repressor / antitoxin RelB